jgi:hypothetical protein
MNIFALYAAIITYALFCSPTPDLIGWGECVVAVLLIISVGFSGIGTVITDDIQSRIIQFHRVFVLFMLSIPTMIGVINGHILSDIVRDIIPILFLILPLSFYGRNMEGFATVLTIAGALFAIRYLVPYIPYFDFLPNESSVLLYLANSPLVPFAAIVGFYWAVDNHPSFLTKRLCGCVISVICFTAMMAMMQRAPIILSAISCIIILAIQAKNKPLHSIVMTMIIITILYPIYPILIEVGLNLSEKTITVGFNNRIEEFTSALSELSWFGHGWGHVWQSPAVGDMWVRFTHNIISYYALKAGIIGSIMAICFVIMWIGYGINHIKTKPEIMLAILTPLVIHMLLYTGFKTLDFALLLTLLILCQRNRSLS